MSTLNEELTELRRLKDVAENDGKDKKAADAAFKQHMAACLQRMEIEGCKSFRGSEYLFSTVEKVKGQIEDRRPYIRWALENDPAILEFLDQLHNAGFAAKYPAETVQSLENMFFDAITGTAAVEYKEKTDIMNQQARAHVDDGAPLPPGLTFRPDPYISMKKS